MKVIRIAIACSALLAGSLAIAGPVAAAPAAATSSVKVVPRAGLTGGDIVRVKGTRLTSSATVRVIECDSLFSEGDPSPACSALTTATADSAGNVSLSVRLDDPVYHAVPEGDPTPVYCRADHCRIFLVWTDQSGARHAAASRSLKFKGSPATITVQPATNLGTQQWVDVSGTAYGASRHTVLIREEACYDIVQGSGCYEGLPVVSTTVRPNGSYAVRYLAQRFLAYGTDCTDPDILGACEMSVTVLDTNGNPDDSFGVSRRGQPAAWLSFQTG